MKLHRLFNRKAALTLSVLVLLVGFGFVVSRSGPLAPTQVTTTRLATDELSSALFGIGTVEARRNYLIGPTAAGRVKAVHVDVGESVKAGQLLAEIDPVDLDDRLRSIDAAFARATATVAAAQAQRSDMTAKEKLASLAATRYQELSAKQFVSPSAVDTRIQEQVSAQAAVALSEANLAGARQELVRLQADKDGLRQQKNTLHLRAPHDGVIISRDAEAGSTVVAGQPVVRMLEPDSLWVKTRLDQGRSRGLAVGQRAQITLRSNATVRLPGQVARIEPISDSVTEERIALVTFDQSPAGLSIGEMAEVSIQTSAGGPALVLPNAAIKQSAQGTGVWKLDDGQPRWLAVKIGNTSLDGAVQILSGLTAGDEVVVHSERELTEGRRIKVVTQLTGPRQ